MNLQRKFNENRGDLFELEPGEYKGPLHITRPCVIDGHGATIWDNDGPIIDIAARNVTIKNLNVELLSDNTTRNTVAVFDDSGTANLSNITAIGEVIVGNNSQYWNLPMTIDLGNYNSDDFEEYSFRLPIKARVTIESNIPGVTVSPDLLTPDNNELKIQISDRGQSEIFGYILLRTGKVLRKIIVTGKAENEFEKLASRNNPSLNRTSRNDLGSNSYNNDSRRQSPNASDLSARLNSLAAESRRKNATSSQSRSERPLVPPRGTSQSSGPSKAQSLSDILNQMAAQDKRRR